MEQQYISKGIYQHSQIGDFVSVKNYIFIRKDEKKHLLLRFSNDFNYVVNAMTYFIVQMDGSGKVIARTKITHNALEFYPGTMYVTEEPICVDEYCSDFKIVFTEVISEFYRYEVHPDMITVHYIKIPEPILDLSDLTRSERRKRRDSFVYKYRVGQKKFQERGVAAFVAMIVMLIMLGLEILNMVGLYISAKKPLLFGDLPYVGDLVQDINSVCSSVSKYLSFLAEKEYVLILSFATALIFLVSAAFCIRARRSPK